MLPGVKRIVYSSSASVYGDALSLPMTEEHPFNNRTMYGATKIAGEQFLRAIYEQHQLPYVALRYMNVYGPRMDYKGTYVSVIMKVLDKHRRRRAAGGLRRRLAGLRFRPRRRRRAGQRALDEERGVRRELQRRHRRADDHQRAGHASCSPSPGSRLAIDYRPNEQMFVTNRVGSTEKAARLLGFEATTPLAEGLRSVVRVAAPRDRHAAAGVQVIMAIPITRPFFGPEELRAVQRRSKSGWVVQGPFVREFEQRFSAFTRAPLAAATSSCTTALHLAVAALGLSAGRRGDRARRSPGWRRRTWSSTWARGRVFADIELDTFNVDPAQRRRRDDHEDRRPDSGASVRAVRGHGGAWRAGASGTRCGRSRTPPARLASWSGGRHAGTFGEFGCFSFHPRKSITTGEGGMVTTARRDLHDAVCSLRDHGATKSDRDRHEQPGSFLLASYPHLGYNYRLTDIQGALGCAQMARAQILLDGRARVARRYQEHLAERRLAGAAGGSRRRRARLAVVRLPVPAGGADAARLSTACISAATR